MIEALRVSTEMEGSEEEARSILEKPGRYALKFNHVGIPTTARFDFGPLSLARDLGLLVLAPSWGSSRAHLSSTADSSFMQGGSG
jgi:hypothetical protein